MEPPVLDFASIFYQIFTMQQCVVGLMGCAVHLTELTSPHSFHDVSQVSDNLKTYLRLTKSS